MIYLRELIEYCKAEAVANKFYQSELADWRWFCRQYSKMFFTPLHLVESLPPEKVILSVFEEQLERFDLNKVEDLQALTEQIRRLEDPDYDENQERELQEFISAAEQFEEERLDQGKPVPSLNRRIQKVAEQAATAPPKQGMINLDYLSKQDQEE